MEFDLSQIPPMPAFYQLASNAIQPRPIAWVSTQSADGITNLAPFSFFTVACVAPPVLSLTLTWRRAGPGLSPEKDTLRNLRTTGECVINIVTEALVAVMNQTCGDYPPQTSEIAALGIATTPSQQIAPPGVAASPVRFECRLRQLIPLGEGPGSSHVVLLDVVHVYADDAILSNGMIDPEKLASVGKLGGDGYARTDTRFSLPRPIIGQ